MQCAYFAAFLTAGDFLVTAGFLVAGFLAVVALAVGFAAVAFFAAGLTPAFLATLTSADLRREAVAFLISFFLTAVSISLCAALRLSLVGLAMNDFMALLMSRLMPTLRSRRTCVCFIRLMADLMIGIGVIYLYKVC